MISPCQAAARLVEPSGPSWGLLGRMLSFSRLGVPSLCNRRRPSGLDLRSFPLFCLWLEGSIAIILRRSRLTFPIGLVYKPLGAFAGQSTEALGLRSPRIPDWPATMSSESQDTIINYEPSSVRLRLQIRHVIICPRDARLKFDLSWNGEETTEILCWSMHHIYHLIRPAKSQDDIVRWVSLMADQA